MEETFEKTRGFSIFVSISMVVHVVILLMVLIFHPTPTKAKFQKSGVRVGVKFAPHRLAIQTPTASVITTPQQNQEPPPPVEKKPVVKADPPKKYHPNPR